MSQTTIQPIPQGYHTATPYLTIKDCSKAIDFYKKAFDAEEKVRMNGDDGKVMHAEIKIGDSVLMMTDENLQWNHKGPEQFGGSPISILLYVKNVDEFYEKAIKAGATSVRPVKDEFYGDRMGTLKDPFGFTWSIGTHVEDVSPEEMQKRIKEMKLS
jgi:PhnB protein